MKNTVTTVLRYLLGVVLLINGVNMFLQFMPLPNPQQPELAQRFLNILREAGYFYPILGTVKVFTALALFTNRYLALMLVVMFPITLNGILFHFSMDPSTAVVALIVGFVQVYLMYTNIDKYAPLLQSRS